MVAASVATKYQTELGSTLATNTPKSTDGHWHDFLVGVLAKVQNKGLKRYQTWLILKVCGGPAEKRFKCIFLNQTTHLTSLALFHLFLSIYCCLLTFLHLFLEHTVQSTFILVPIRTNIYIFK